MATTSPGTTFSRSIHLIATPLPRHPEVNPRLLRWPCATDRFGQDLAAELYRLTCCWLMHQYEEARLTSFPPPSMDEWNTRCRRFASGAQNFESIRREVVRAASSLGCDGLSPTESALWMRLGAETANDQHVAPSASAVHSQLRTKRPSFLEKNQLGRTKQV